MSDKNSETPTDGGKLVEIFAALRQKAVTMNKSSGFFISVADANNLEDRVFRAMKDQNSSVSPETLMDLHAQVTTWRARANSAKDRLEASQAVERNLNRDIVGLKESLEAQKRVSASEKTRINSEKEKLISELKTAQTSLASLKTHQPQADSSSPHLASARDEVTRLNNLLQKTNAALNKQDDKVKDLEASVKGLEFSLENEKSTQKRMQTTTYADMASIPPIQMVDNSDSQSFVVSKFWSDKNKESYQKFLQTKQDDLKDRAAKLIEMAKAVGKEHHSNEWRDIAVLLFEKLKGFSYNKRKEYKHIIDSWSETVISRRKSQLNLFKSELGDLFADHTEAINNSDKASQSWWQSIKYDFWLARRKCSVWFREKKQESKSFWHRLKDRIASFTKSFPFRFPFTWG